MAPSPLILALDLATTTGCAIGRPGETPFAWSFTLKGDHAAKFSGLLIALNRVIKDRKPTHMAFECPFIGRPKVAEMLFGLRGCAMGICHWHGLDVEGVSIQRARKHFIGEGGLPGLDAKQAVSERCAQLGWRHKSLDESDALAVWSFRASQLDPGHSRATMRLMDGVGQGRSA